MKVNDVMTQDVVKVLPSTPLKDVARILVERRISGVPVVDEYDEVVGVVSESDIIEKERDPSRRPGPLRRLVSPRHRKAAGKQDARTAAGAMTSPAIEISAYAPVAEAASLMAEHRVDRLVVCEFVVKGDRPKLVGIVTRGDLVRAFARSDTELEHEIRELLDLYGFAPHDVRVAVASGTVTLAGEVPYKHDAEALESTVRRVPGVLGLDSRLTWRFEQVVA